MASDVGSSGAHALYSGASCFNYIHSCDLDTNVAVKIGTLEGSIVRSNYEQLLDDPGLKFRSVSCSKRS